MTILWSCEECGHTFDIKTRECPSCGYDRDCPCCYLRDINQKEPIWHPPVIW